MNRYPIFDPANLPVKGLYSYPIASALQPGQYADIVNLRWDDGSLRVRPGIYEEQSDARTTGSVYIPDIVIGGAINEGTFYGGILARLNQSGDYAAICAVEVSAGTIGFFYNYFNGTVWSGWSQYTAGTVETGSTSTMATPTFGYVSITPIPNSNEGLDGFVAQNGAENPCFLGNPLSASTVWRINDVLGPTQCASYAPVAGPLGYVDIAGTSGGGAAMVAGWPASGTHYTSDGTFDPTTAGAIDGDTATSGTAPDIYWLAETGGDGTALPAVGDFCWFRAHADDDGDFTGAKQVWILADTNGDDTWFTCCKWYVTGTTAGDLLIHDPSDFKDSRVSLSVSGNIRLYAFSFDDHAGKNLTDINGIKIEVVNAGLTANVQCKIHGLMAGGDALGTSHYSGSFYNSNTRSESPAVNYSPFAKGVALINYGCSVAETVTLPVDSRLFYAHDVPVFAPTQAEAQKGVYWFRIYRQDPGEEFDDPELYYLVDDVNVALYDTGSANGPGATNRAETVYAMFGNDEQAWSEKAVSGTFVDEVEKYDRDYETRKPPEYAISCPRGTDAVYANGKMYVCGARGSSNSIRNNAIAESALDKPMRFAYVVPRSDGTIDRDAGILHTLEDENAVRIIAAATSLVGASNVFCFTDKSVYAIDEAPIKIADVGTVAPGSVASQDGVIFFVDQDMVVRQMDAIARDISRYRVHDKLVDVPAAYRKFMSGAVYQGRYYLAHASNSSNQNHKILVYNPSLGEWESEDSVPVTVPCSQFFKWVYGSEGKLMFFTKNGQLWQYEREGTVDDNGTAISASLTLWRLHSDWQRIIVGQAQVVCDDQNSRTLTVARSSIKPIGNTATGTMSLDAGGSETSVWRVDENAAGQMPQCEGCAVDVVISTAVQHPWAIQSIYLDSTLNAGVGEDD